MRPNKPSPATGPATERLGHAGPGVYALKRCRLEVLSGPDAGLGRTFDCASIRVGSGPDCELALSDPAVSREHAILALARDGYWLRDNESTNGTILDGVRVKEAYLGAGSVFEVGRSRVRFEPADESISAEPSPSESFHDILARNAAMRQLFTVLGRLAQTSVSVLLHGETGTGKELFARALHKASPRAGAPFVVFDCANTDRELVRSELFGHEPGAFTGATGVRLGAFERARGGTVFLDEVGELPPDLQPRLLRVLQEREVTRLGGSEVRKLDVRVVAATHRDLPQMVDTGGFREDLYFRLAQVVLQVPALRDRPEDVPVLAGAFLERAAPGRRFKVGALAKLAATSWRGNVRELKNYVEAIAALSDSQELGPEDFPPMGRARTDTSSSPASGFAGSSPAAAGHTLEDVERETIARSLQAHGGNLTRTAKALGIARVTLREKLKRYGLARAK